MNNKSKVKKDTFSLRIPTELHQKLYERAEKMGISKSALILSLIYKEVGENSQNQEYKNDRN